MSCTYRNDKKPKQTKQMNKEITEGIVSYVRQGRDSKKTAKSSIIMAVGIAAALVSFITDTDSSVGYLLLIAGSLTAIYGGICLAFGSESMYLTDGGGRIEVENIFLPSASKEKAETLLEARDFKGLQGLKPTKSQQPVCIRAYVAEKADFVGIQLLEYVPYEYKPVGILRVYKAQDAAAAKTFLEGVKS